MDDASRDIPIPSIEFPSYHLVTDGAMSPPVRTDEHVSTHKSHKRTNSVTEGRAPLAEPTRRQQTLTASSQTTKSGYHHHSSIQPIFESLLQKAHPGNKTHSSIRPSGQATKQDGKQQKPHKRGKGCLLSKSTLLQGTKGSDQKTCKSSRKRGTIVRQQQQSPQ
jgi:hypothetical protein